MIQLVYRILARSKDTHHIFLNKNGEWYARLNFYDSDTQTVRRVGIPLKAYTKEDAIKKRDRLINNLVKNCSKGGIHGKVDNVRSKYCA